MHLHHINLLAVLVAAISTMIVGFLWYSPLLFAKPWMREMGYDSDDKAKIQQMQKSAGPAYAGSFVASLISAFVLALVFHWMRVGVCTRLSEPPSTCGSASSPPSNSPICSSRKRA